MHRVIALAIVALAAGCPTPLPPVDAGPEDAGPPPTIFQCHSEATCDEGLNGITHLSGDFTVCATSELDAIDRLDLVGACSRSCGAGEVVDCVNQCRPSDTAPDCTPN